MEALQATGLLDSPVEEAFDRLTRLACRLLRVPTALVSLVDADRQFFKSSQGLPEPWASCRETPLSHSFCQHVVVLEEPLVIEDAREHPLVSENLAIDDLGVIAYLGIPLRAPEGQPIGSLCAIQGSPRRWSEDDIALLSDLAASVMSEVAARVHLQELAKKEEALHRLNETLERRVAERTDELSRANIELAQRNRELQDFAYVASHDLQEPLRKVQAFAGLFVEDFSERVDETGRFYLDRMQDAASRMSKLINDLLVYSRVVTKGRPFVQVDLAEVAVGVVRDLEIRIRDTDAEVHLGALPTIEADPMQMRQLLQNLIANALKFRREGVRPVVHLSAEVVGPDELSGEEDREVCRLEVEDNGIGFEEKYLDRIFTPFQRLHGREAYAGTGMGLAICRRIAERHGGTITARSTPGEGTTFIVELPVSSPKSEVPSPK